MRDATLIIGGTRGTGAAAARQLIEAGVRVRVLARDAERARRTLPQAEIAVGDVTLAQTLVEAANGVEGVIYTAGIGEFFAEARSRAVVVDGVRNAVEAAQACGTVRRFVFMSSIGVARPSLFGWLLDLAKGGALRHKAEAEGLLRASDVAYTIVRAGVLTNHGAGTRPVRLGQDDLPLRANLLIARADAARVLVRALREPRAEDVTFDAVWGHRGEPDLDFSALMRDDASGRARSRPAAG